MYDGELLSKLLERENNAPLKEVFSCVDPQERLEKLLNLKPYVDREAYAMYVRMVLQFDTHGLLFETILEALNGLKQEDLMHQSEIDKLSEYPELLTIYRGTDISENTPRIFWSLSAEIAMSHYQGILFRATVNKHDIFAYFCCNCNEEEVLALVTDNFTIL